MSVTTDSVGSVVTSRLPSLSTIGVNALGFIQSLRAKAQLLGNSKIIDAKCIKSALVADVGFINLYEVEVRGSVLSLSSLMNGRLRGYSAVDLSAELVQGLSLYLRDLDSQYLYLLEYPDGFILAINDSLLGFQINATTKNHTN